MQDEGAESVCFSNAARKVVSKCSSFGGLDRNICPKSAYCCVQMIVMMDSVNCCLPLLQVPELGVRNGANQDPSAAETEGQRAEDLSPLRIAD